jgi:hypothetical protein
MILRLLNVFENDFLDLIIEFAVKSALYPGIHFKRPATSGSFSELLAAFER